jgi:hypothetical protein
VSVAAAGALVALAAGGGFALASGTSNTIHACVHKHGGDVYIAKKCAKHDKKVSWNKTGPAGAPGQKGDKGDTGNPGPQGPGATSFVYDAAGAASPTRTALGTMGPWTVTGLCTQSGGNTGAEIDITGPGLHLDGSGVAGNNADAFSGTLAGPLTNSLLLAIPPLSTQLIASVNEFLVPTSGSPVHLSVTLIATGGTPPAGAAANTCHASFVITPVAAPASSATAALTHVPAGKSSARPLGKALLGLPFLR